MELAYRHPGSLAMALFSLSFCRRFRKVVGGRGVGDKQPLKKSPKSSPEICTPFLKEGIGKRVQKLRPESLAFEGFPRANPFSKLLNFWGFSSEEKNQHKHKNSSGRMPALTTHTPLIKGVEVRPLN